MKVDKSGNNILENHFDHNHKKNEHGIMVRQVIRNSVKPCGAPWVTLNKLGRILTMSKKPLLFLGGTWVIPIWGWLKT